VTAPFSPSTSQLTSSSHRIDSLSLDDDGDDFDGMLLDPRMIVLTETLISRPRCRAGRHTLVMGGV